MQTTEKSPSEALVKNRYQLKNHLRKKQPREGQKFTDIEYQPLEDISVDELQTALKKTSSWKSPGPDAVPNKQLTALHHHLLNTYNQVIEQPEHLPDWFTTAQTYLLPKNKNRENPQNYRPIACLSASYKVLTSILTERSYTHITKNDIILEEQRACARNSYGCKDQLLMNKMIIEDCKKKKKSLSMAWIDYRKAYDSVPHRWILKTLRMYRINEKLFKFMEALISNWKTTMKLFYNVGCITTDQIKIKSGIFQGDSFSPLLFCLALVPLTSELATSGYGYKISNTSAPISNLFYMDDLKLYSKNEQEQIGELKVVKQFSDDIGMEFGLEKCAKASFKEGKLTSTGNIVIDVDPEVQELDQEGVYKYLGADESDGIQHSKMKEKIRREYNRRVRSILTTELNGRNKMEAINSSLAVPVVQYNFGIIDGRISELKKIDTKTRKLLNMQKMLHPKADVERLYIPRKD